MRQDYLFRFVQRETPRFPVLAFVATCCLALFFTACDMNHDTDLALSNGEFPLTFIARVEVPALTRATTDNGWNGGEEVAIQINNEVRKYKATVNGALSAPAGGTPFYWQMSTERKTVEAWYSSDYSKTEPTSFSVLPDQTAKGYQQSDFLYAPAKEFSFNDRYTAILSFYHQITCVVINIKTSDAITDAGGIRNVVIGDVNANNLALSGAYTAPTGAGTTVGTWDTSNGSLGTITPKEIAPAGSGYLKTYAALVIPQQMQGKKFIAVTLKNGLTYYYIPANDEANLQGGKVHTYDITVKNSYLKVEEIKDGEWEKGENETVKGSVETFNAEDLKVGDFFYSDGTWSDGGLRELYGDSTARIDNDVMPLGGKTLLGIVMKVGRDITGNWKDDCQYKTKEGLKMDNIKGYVLSLYEASNGKKFSWGPREKVSYKNADSVEMMNRELNGFYGYKNTQAIILFNRQKSTPLSSYPATNAVLQYESDHAAPSNTSGWFLPSIGQCLYWMKYRHVILPSIRKKLGGETEWSKVYYSSTERDDNNAWGMEPLSVTTSTGKKSLGRPVRACLAFPPVTNKTE